MCILILWPPALLLWSSPVIALLSHEDCFYVCLSWLSLHHKVLFFKAQMTESQRWIGFWMLNLNLYCSSWWSVNNWWRKTLTLVLTNREHHHGSAGEPEAWSDLLCKSFCIQQDGWWAILSYGGADSTSRSLLWSGSPALPWLHTLHRSLDMFSIGVFLS